MLINLVLYKIETLTNKYDFKILDKLYLYDDIYKIQHNIYEMYLFNIIIK